MNVKELRERIKAINERMQELDQEIDGATVERLGEIDTEVRKLKSERSTKQALLEEATRAAFEDGEETPSQAELRKQAAAKKLEERVRDLKQNRAITIADTDLIDNNIKGTTMNPTFNQVSHMVDKIGIQPLKGGESFQQAYMKDYSTAGYTAEGADYTEGEPTWDYADINKSKITIYTEISEEFEKLSPSFYMAEINKNLRIALKKKLAVEALFGDGTTNHLVGIFDDDATAIDPLTDIEINTIDETTLDQLIYGYGGDEDIEPGVLVLSKADLRAFAAVRGTQDKKRVYKIDHKNKTIDGIPYEINGAITPLASASVGDYIMAYGSLKNYKLVSFADIQIMKSYDYKFKQGQICFKASGIFGGNVVSWNGFVRVKKSA